MIDDNTETTHILKLPSLISMLQLAIRNTLETNKKIKLAKKYIKKAPNGIFRTVKYNNQNFTTSLDGLSSRIEMTD